MSNSSASLSTSASPVSTGCKLSEVDRTTLLQLLSPYLKWQSEDALKERPDEVDNKVPKALAKKLDALMFVASRGEKGCWAHLARNPVLVEERSIDAIAHSYLAAMQGLGHRHPISLLFFDTLNMLIAAQQEGATVLADLLRSPTKDSFKQLNCAKERYLDNDYARQSKVLDGHFNTGVKSQNRRRKLTAAIVGLALLNVVVYIHRNFYSNANSDSLALSTIDG